MHLGWFGCLKKLGAKWSELVQNFVPRSHIRIFHNEPTLSTPLDPKLMFWCISYHLGAFACKSSWHEDVSEFFATNAPDPPHWTLNWRFGAFHSICMHSGPFGSHTKLGAKRTELVQKFVPQSCIGIFRNEGTQSTLLDPKLIVAEPLWIIPVRVHYAPQLV